MKIKNHFLTATALSAAILTAPSSTNAQIIEMATFPLSMTEAVQGLSSFVGTVTGSSPDSPQALRAMARSSADIVAKNDTILMELNSISGVIDENVRLAFAENQTRVFESLVYDYQVQMNMHGENIDAAWARDFTRDIEAEMYQLAQYGLPTFPYYVAGTMAMLNVAHHGLDYDAQSMHDLISDHLALLDQYKTHASFELLEENEQGEEIYQAIDRYEEELRNVATSLTSHEVNPAPARYQPNRSEPDIPSEEQLDNMEALQFRA